MATEGLGDNNNLRETTNQPLGNPKDEKALPCKLSSEEKRTQVSARKLHLGSFGLTPSENVTKRRWALLDTRETREFQRIYSMSKAKSLSEREHRVLFSFIGIRSTGWREFKGALRNFSDQISQSIQDGNRYKQKTLSLEKRAAIESINLDLEELNRILLSFADNIESTSVPSLTDLIKFRRDSISLQRNFLKKMEDPNLPPSYNHIRPFIRDYSNLLKLYKIPSSKDLEDIGDFIRLCSKNKPLQDNLLKISQTKNIALEERQGAWDLSRLAQLTLSIDAYQAISEKIRDLKERSSRGEEIPEADKLTPQEAHDIDSLRSSSDLVHIINSFVNQEHEEIKTLCDLLDILDSQLEGLNFDHWEEGSITFSELENQMNYRGELPPLLRKAHLSVYKTFTKSTACHAAMIYNGASTEHELRESHILDKYKEEAISNNRIGKACYQSAYKVRMSGIISSQEAQQFIQQ